MTIAMTLSSFCNKTIALLVSLAFGTALAQAPGALSVADQTKITVGRDALVEHKLQLAVKEGFHVNSNTPNDEYLIPLKMTWGEGPLEAAPVMFPKPKLERYPFNPQPLSIFDGSFELTTRFKVKAGTSPGPAFQTGKLRYQACTDKLCLPPKTIDVKVPVLVQ
jgi:hypothetical protein